MYRVILSVHRWKAERDFETRQEAQEVVTALQELFIERGFKFVAYDRLTNFYLYKHPDETRGRVGLFILPTAKKDGEPFLRTRKKPSASS